EIRESEVLENLLDDVRCLLILEDAAIRRAREEPRPGHQLGVKAAVAIPPHGSRREPDDDAMEVPPLALLGPLQGLQPDGDTLAEDVLWLNGPLRQQFEVEAEELREVLFAIEIGGDKRIRAKRRVEDDRPVGLLEDYVSHDYFPTDWFGGCVARHGVGK